MSRLIGKLVFLDIYIKIANKLLLTHSMEENPFLKASIYSTFNGFPVFLEPELFLSCMQEPNTYHSPVSDGELYQHITITNQTRTKADDVSLHRI
jgi:hypothetical protein